MKTSSFLERLAASVMTAFMAAFLPAFPLLSAPPAARAEFVWGVNGHPFVSYPGVSYEQQLDYVRDLGMTSYRVNVSELAHIPRLAHLLKLAQARGLTLLPVLTPAGTDLKKDTPEELYKKAYAFAMALVSRFREDIRVWELGNELENFAILQPCEMQDDGVQYNCAWGPASGVDPLEYHGGRWAKVSAALKGLSDGTAAADPTVRKAIGTAGWGHVGAFERMRRDGIQWDISVWHFYGDDPEWGLARVAPFGKPIWITEVNYPNGSLKGVTQQSVGLQKILQRISDLKNRYKVEAVHIYELLDETYWAPSSEAVMGLVYLDRNSKGGWVPGGPKPAYCAVRTLLAGGWRTPSPPLTSAALAVRALKGPVPLRRCDLCAFDNRDASPQNKAAYAYCLSLGREPDGYGFADWSKHLAEGKPVTDMISAMLQSEEFAVAHKGSLPDESSYVRLIYRVLLDRDPDGQGHADYTKALERKELTREAFVRSLLSSDEFRALHSVLFRSASPSGGQ